MGRTVDALYTHSYAWSATTESVGWCKSDESLPCYSGIVLRNGAKGLSCRRMMRQERCGRAWENIPPVRRFARDRGGGHTRRPGVSVVTLSLGSGIRSLASIAEKAHVREVHAACFAVVLSVALLGSLACDGSDSPLGPTDDPTPPQTLLTAATAEPPSTPRTAIESEATEESSRGFTIYFLDVGEGDAILVETSTGERLLVDGGPSKALIRNHLARLGVDDLDALLATHADADHVAGLAAILEDYDVERIYWNGVPSDTDTFENFMALSEDEAAELKVIARGDVITLGDLKIRVLHPAELTGDSNVDSIVVLVQCGPVEVLLTGDAEGESERSMLAAGVLMDVDILKVGNHGSRTSTSQEFLEVVRPEFGVINSGVGTQFVHPYHPHKDALDALSAANVQILRTDTTVEPDGVTVTTSCDGYEFTKPLRFTRDLSDSD